MSRAAAGIGLLFASLVALAFLVYTLAHLEELGIPLLHGRVIVEGVLFVAFGAAGLYLLST